MNPLALFGSFGSVVNVIRSKAHKISAIRLASWSPDIRTNSASLDSLSLLTKATGWAISK